MSCQKDLFKQLREQGFRLTPQREMVLSVMHEMDGFATAEQIYERVQAISSSVDISTIYRTLDLFQDFRVVASVDRGDGHRRFKLWDVTGPHVHLVCRACGNVIGLDSERIRSLVVYLKEHLGFEVDPEHLSVPGLCRACRAERAGAEG
jgi:Fur family ferric uptake transcriptional regulator